MKWHVSTWWGETSACQSLSTHVYKEHHEGKAGSFWPGLRPQTIWNDCGSESFQQERATDSKYFCHLQRNPKRAGSFLAYSLSKLSNARTKITGKLCGRTLALVPQVKLLLLHCAIYFIPARPSSATPVFYTSTVLLNATALLQNINTGPHLTTNSCGSLCWHSMGNTLYQRGAE